VKKINKNVPIIILQKNHSNVKKNFTETSFLFVALIL